jgi:hypothetical protein
LPIVVAASVLISFGMQMAKLLNVVCLRKAFRPN